MVTGVMQLVKDLVTQGRWDEAQSALRDWLGKKPEDHEACQSLAVLLYTEGRYSEAEQILVPLSALSGERGSQANYYLGLAMLKQGRANDAIAFFRTACECMEGNALAHLHWGLALSLTASYRGAIGQFKQAYKLDPLLAVAAYEAGVAFVRLGQYQDAVENFRDAAAADPNFAEAFNGLGIALASLGLFDQAMNAFKEAAKRDDQQALFKRNLALVLNYLGRYAESCAICQEALSQQPQVMEAADRALIYNDLAVSLYLQGRAEEAADKLIEASAVDPSLIQARVNLGLVRLAQDEAEQAAECFEKALELEAEQPPIYFLLGISNFILRRYEDAGRYLLQAQERGHTDSYLSLWIGYVFVAERQFQAAEKMFHESLSLDGGNFLAADALGTCLALMGRHSEAVGKFQQCISLRPDHGIAYIHLGRSLESLGKMQESYQAFVQAVRLDPDSLEPEKEIIDILLRHGQYDAALKRARRLLQVDANDIELLLLECRALKALLRTEEASERILVILNRDPSCGAALNIQGQIYLANGQLLEADEKFRQAAQYADDDVVLYYCWGKTLALLGLHELALEKFEKANDIDPFDTDTYEAWGATLKFLGRYQEAADVFKKAAEYF